MWVEIALGAYGSVAVFLFGVMVAGDDPLSDTVLISCLWPIAMGVPFAVASVYRVADPCGDWFWKRYIEPLLPSRDLEDEYGYTRVRSWRYRACNELADEHDVWRIRVYRAVAQRHREYHSFIDWWFDGWHVVSTRTLGRAGTWIRGAIR